MRLSVIGTNYLGAVHAAAMTDLGHGVVGIDIDPGKVAALNQGRAPIYEPGLDDLLVRGLGSGRLRFSTDYAEVADADVHFVCVGTPARPGELAADLAQVNAAFASLAPHLVRPTVVVGKSTVPVGTAARLREQLAGHAPVGADAHVVWNPEFLRESEAIHDTLHPNRLVYGLHDPADDHDRLVLDEVYARTIAEDGTPVVVTDYATAELVKTGSNAFLTMKLSFINAMAELCEASGADVVQLAEAIGHDDRIGHSFLRAGLGFGGGCLPKDIRALMARAGELGADQVLTLMREVDAINGRRRSRAVQIARECIGGDFAGTKVAVLGAAFKAGTDDIRDSPALDVATCVHAEGADVVVHDPRALANVARAHPELKVAECMEDALSGADLVLHLTAWPVYQDIDPRHTATVVRARRVLDANNALDRSAWQRAGWSYRALGRPQT